MVLPLGLVFEVPVLLELLALDVALLLELELLDEVPLLELDVLDVALELLVLLEAVDAAVLPLLELLVALEPSRCSTSWRRTFPTWRPSPLEPVAAAPDVALLDALVDVPEPHPRPPHQDDAR